MRWGKKIRRLAVEHARAEARSLRTWYRHRYDLPPNDPRYLGITYPELLADYELHFASASADPATVCPSCRTVVKLPARICPKCRVVPGVPANICPRCKVETYQPACPAGCLDSEGRPLVLSGDSVIDSLREKIERGEPVDLDDPANWVDVEV